MHHCLQGHKNENNNLPDLIAIENAVLNWHRVAVAVDFFANCFITKNSQLT